MTHDLLASGHIVFRFEHKTFAPDLENQLQAMFIWGEAGQGRGVYVTRGDSLRDRVAELADFVQEEMIEARYEAGLPVYWPQCPDHPHSHPAVVSERFPRPHWVCPANDAIDIGEVGTLTAKEPPLRRR